MATTPTTTASTTTPTVSGAAAPTPVDVGSAPTAPGQIEIIAGTPEHMRVLGSFPSASSYGPDVNVVLPPEEPPPDPPSTLAGAAATKGSV